MHARLLSPSRALSPPTPPKKEALTGRTTPVFFSSTDPKSPPTPLRVAPHSSWRGPAVVDAAAVEAVAARAAVRARRVRGAMAGGVVAVGEGGCWGMWV